MTTKTVTRRNHIGATVPSLARQLRVLADPTRLAILELLMKGLQCNCNLGDRLGLPMNLVSHHLKVLRGAGLVKFSRDTKDGRWIYYAVDAKGVAKLRGAVSSFLSPEKIMKRLAVCGPQLATTGAEE
jgi:DNA-binding transcriptional ArsR family regulator